MVLNSIPECLAAKDALSREVAKFLIGYEEEDGQVDYKEEFDAGEDKAWLELAKDVSSFANTNGGYLVFGVRDSDKSIVGVSPDTRAVLSDANNVLQKINRNFEPDFCDVRTKVFRFDGKYIVLLLAPVSVGLTHIVSKEGKFKFRSGKERVLLRKGTFYVRRSGGNHLVDSRDLDALIERRIDQFRDTLLDKIARIVKAPATTDVYLLSRDRDSSGKSFVLEDSSDAVAVKGTSFTIPPVGAEQEIAAWSVIYDGDARAIPPPHLLWAWYREREKLSLSEKHLLTLFQFSLWLDAPSFYWIQNLRTQDIQKKLAESIEHRPQTALLTPMLMVASFLGASTYTRALRLLKRVEHRIQPTLKKFPSPSPSAYFGHYKTGRNQTEPKLRKEKLGRLNEIATSAAEAKKEPGVARRMEARKIDCFLYSRVDKYQAKVT